MVAMVLGMLGIMGALVWKLTQTPSTGNAGAMLAGEIEIPIGYQILNVSKSGSSLFLVLENVETGERLLQERGSERQKLIGQYQLREIEK